jgi:soluble lytic murein transglycosylase
LSAAVLLIAADRAPHAQRVSPSDATPSLTASALVPTNHPVLPRDLSSLWFAPLGSGASARTGGSSPFAAAMKLADREDYAKALPLLSQPQAQQGPLGEYALYYAGLAELRLGNHERARALFKQVQERGPIGYLAEAAALGEAECAEAADDYAGAAAIYERLSGTRTTAPDEVLLKLGAAAKAAGDFKTAAEAFGRVLYEFPLSSSAPSAEQEYASLPGVAPIAAGTRRFELELGRAERLFGSRRYPEARKVFEALRPAARGDARELVDLRLAECDYYQRRFRSARDRVKPYTERASRQGEALYFYAVSVADLGDRATYLKTVRRIVDEFPTQSWAEEALNNLATRHIVADEDDQADAVFRELYAKYPRGAYADRAAWRVGWRSYRQERFAETVSYFERAAADFPRSDYRPAWLYWSGRAHERLNAPAVARARFELAAADYLNSYYGRLATKQLDGRLPPPRVVGTPTSVLPPPPNEALIRTLLGIERYDDALNELRYAQRAWGDSPALQARLDHGDAAGISAVHGRRRGTAAARDPHDDLSAVVLGADPEIL